MAIFTEEHFFRVNPPDWMVSDLKRMPNNEGYVFKNIWFFGEKPMIGNTSKVTEANKGYKNNNNMGPWLRTCI